MKKILVLSLLISAHAMAQDPVVKELQTQGTKKVQKDPADTLSKKWQKGGLFTLNIAQGSLSNWQGGGDKASFSAIASLHLYAFYKFGKYAWDNTLDLGYGYLNTTSLGSRKSDDRMDYLSKLGYLLKKKWYAGALFNFRSQFAKGFEYGKDANGVETKTLTSASFAPAYVLLSLGVEYRPNDHFSVFISPVSERWTIVSNNYLSSIGAYGVASGHVSRNELGAFLTTEFNKEVGKNVTYKTRLDLFSNYKSKPQNVDMYWTNALNMKVNKILSANILLDLVYDDDAIGRLQIRQLIGAGVSLKF